ncbi:AraC family transcriptional regulator ligand-binding domain-containing protein [Bacterioplanoides sp.]|uniref:AraC family transcriptional regulator n=1 Tax=Bacterioplanoides sp. TaxID=2066072 RepID=UPI003B59F4EB
MVMTATSYGGWVIAIARALESYNIDANEILPKADIDIDKAYDPNARFEVIKSTKLFDYALKESNDPCFGLRVGKMMRPTSWHSLGFALWSSNNLHEALDRITKYIKIFTTAARANIDEKDDRIRLSGSAYPAYKPVLSNAQYEAFLATIALLCRNLYPGTFRPLKVGLPRAIPLEDMTPFNDIFQCHIEFNQSSVWIEIDKKTAQQRLPTANPELAQINDQLCAKYIARFDKSDLASRVYYLLLETLSDGEPSMDEVSTALNVSSRSLQRKLKESGTNFKSLLDGVRKELSLQYIQQSHMPLGEISYRLGFSHVSNFSRAFKRWTQVSPAEWRASKT